MPILAGVLVFVTGVFVSGFFDLYFKFSHLDTLFHFIGGMALGWFFYILIFSKGLRPASDDGNGAESTDKNFSVAMQLFILVSAVSFAGIIWEYAERLSTIYASVHAPWLYHWFSGGNLNDTLLDLLADMLGGAVFFGFFRKFADVSQE